MTTPNTPNAAERPRLTELYQEVCDAELRARFCPITNAERDALYQRSCELETAFINTLAELDSHHPAESVSAEPVADRPEVECRYFFFPNPNVEGHQIELEWGFEYEAKGVHEKYFHPLHESDYLHPQPSAPGAVSDEDVEYALGCEVEQGWSVIEFLDTDRMLCDGHDGVRKIIRVALESFAKRSAEAKERDTTTVFLADVEAELRHARAKFPGDRIMTIALAEEFGELAKAVLDEPSAQVYKEAVQTAVMAARVVIDGDGSVNEWRAAKGLDCLTDASRSAAQ